MFRDDPECSGMIRNVPGCSMFLVLSTPKVLREFSKVMQTLDCVSGLHNCLEFFKSTSCLDDEVEWLNLSLLSNRSCRPIHKFPRIFGTFGIFRDVQKVFPWLFWLSVVFSSLFPWNMTQFYARNNSVQRFPPSKTKERRKERSANWRMLVKWSKRLRNLFPRHLPLQESFKFSTSVIQNRCIFTAKIREISRVFELSRNLWLKFRRFFENVRNL